MSQKFKDLLLMIRKQRRAQVFVGIILVAILYLIFGTSQPRNQVSMRLHPQAQQGTGATSPQEGTEDLIKSLVKDINDLKSSVQTSQTQTETLSQEMNKYEARTAEIFKKILEKMADNQAAAPGAGSSPQAVGPEPVSVPDENVAPSNPVDVAEPESYNAPGSEMETFGEMDQNAVAPPAAPAAQSRVAFVGVGDSVRVKLLSGVNAPTDGTPYPVVFQLVSDVYGPNSSTLPLGEARLMAAAQGSLSDSRALFRLTDIDIALPNGRRKVLKVDGWVVGEDGMKGLQGRLIDPIGKVIGGMGFAGLIGGLGEGLAAANTTTFTYGNGNSTTYIDGSIGQYAAGKAGSSAARAWEGIIKERAEKLVPLVQVLSNREATAIFSQSFTVADLFDAYNQQEEGAGYAD